MREIDEKIVRMKFDNEQFERGIKTTMNTLNDFKSSLKFEDTSAGINDVIDHLRSMNTVDLAGLIGRIGLVNDVVTKLRHKITGVFNDLVIAPKTTGFQEYEQKMGSVQTIMNSSGASLEKVMDTLEELNKYADDTIYSFSDMTSNIGKFTNAGVDLDTAVAAIKGISNEAAVAGANANEASRAMYNFAQAISSGSVKLIDWKSIENANMATKDFKTQLIQTAVELGTLNKVGEDYISTTTDNTGHVSDAFNATKAFNDSLKAQWMTTEVLTKTLAKYSDENTEFGKKAYAAAKDVKTLTQMMDTLKEAAQSGWSTTWEIIAGNFEEAKKLWTNVGNAIGDLISKSADYRNNILKTWKDLGGRDSLISALSNIWKPISQIIELFENARNRIFGFKQLGTWLAEASKNLSILTAKLELNKPVLDVIEYIIEGVLVTVKDIFRVAFTMIKSLSPIVKNVKTAISIIWKELAKTAQVFNDITAGRGFLISLPEILDRIASVIRRVADTASKVLIPISKAISTVIHLITKIVDHWNALFVDIWNVTGDFWEALKRATVDGFESTFEIILDFLGDVTGLDFFHDLAAIWQEAFYTVWNVIDGVLTVIFKAFKRAKAIFDAYGGGLGGIFIGALSGIRYAWNEFFNWLENTTGWTWLERVRKAIESALGWIQEKAKTFFSWIGEFLSPVSDFFGSMFSDSTSSISDAVDSVDAVATKAETTLEKFKSIKDLALEIIRGDWGNGLDRDQRLAEAGLDNDTAQGVVNRIFTLNGEFREGWEDVLAQYENVNAYLDGTLDKNSSKYKAMLAASRKFVKDLEKKSIQDPKNRRFRTGESTDTDTNYGSIDKANALVDIQITIAKTLSKIGPAIESVKAKAASVIQSIGNWILSNWPRIKAMGIGVFNFLKYVGGMAWNGIVKAFTSVKNVFRDLGPAIDTISRGLTNLDFKTIGSGFSKAFKKIWSNIQTDIDSALGDNPWYKKLKDIFASITKFGDGAWSGLTNGFGAVKKAFADAKPGLDIFTEGFANADFAKMGEGIKTFFSNLWGSLTTSVSDALNNTGWFTKLKDIFSSFVDFITTLFTGKNKEGETIERLETLKSGAQAISATVQTFTAAAEESGDSGSVLSWLKNKVVKLFKALGKVMPILSNFLKGYGIFKIGKALLGFTKIAKGIDLGGGIAKFTESIGKTFDGVKELVGKSQSLIVTGKGLNWKATDNFATKMLKFAAAFAIIVGVVVALSYLPQDQVFTGLKTAGAILLAILGFYTAVGVVNKVLGNNPGIEVSGLGKGILFLAAGIAIIAVAVLAFNAMKPKTLVKGFSMIALTLLSFVVAMRLIKPKDAESTGKAILMIAIAIDLLTIAVGVFGHMDVGVMIQGLLGVIGLLGAIVLAIRLMPDSSKGMPSLIAFSASLYVLASKVQELGKMPLGQYIQGLIGVAGLLLALGLAVRLAGEGSKESILSLVSILGMVGALQLVILIVQEIPATFEQASVLASISGILLSLAGSIALLKGSDWASGAKAALQVAEFIGVTIAAFAAIGGINLGVKAVTEALGVEGGVDLLSIAGDTLSRMLTWLSEVTPTAMDVLTGIADGLVPICTDIGAAIGGLVGALFGSVVGEAVGSYDEATSKHETNALNYLVNNFQPPEEGKLEEVKQTLLELAAVKDALPKEGGFDGLIHGTKEWGYIGDGLAAMGQALVDFETAITDEEGNLNIHSEVIGGMVEPCTQLINLKGKIPKRSWFDNLFVGTSEWSSIGNGLAEFGTALKAFSDALVLNGTVDAQAILDIQAPASALIDLHNTIKGADVEELKSWFGAFSETNTSFVGTWGDVTSGLVSFGTALCDFSNAITDENGIVNVDTDAITNIYPAASAIIDLKNQLTADKVTEIKTFFGIFKSVTIEETEYGNLITFVSALGESLTGLSGAVAEIPNMSEVLSAIDAVSAVYGVLKIENNEYFAADSVVYDLLPIVSSTVGEFAESLEGVNIDRITAVKDAILGFTTNLPETTEGLDSFAVALNVIALDAITSFSKAFSPEDSIAAPKYAAAASNFYNGFNDAVKEYKLSFDTTGRTVLNYIFTALETDEINQAKYNTFGSNFRSAFCTAIWDQKESIKTRGRDVMAWLSGAIEGEINMVYQSGVNTMIGFANGMQSQMGKVIVTARSIARSVAPAVNNTLEIRSPSRVLDQSGMYTILGYVNGMNRTAPQAYSAAQTIAGTMGGILSRANFMLNNDYVPRITPVVDLSNVGAASRQIGGMFGNYGIVANASIENARSVQMLNRDTDADPVNNTIPDALVNIQNEISSLKESMNNLKVFLDGNTLVGSISNRMDQSLARNAMYKRRGI